MAQSARDREGGLEGHPPMLPAAALPLVWATIATLAAAHHARDATIAIVVFAPLSVVLAMVAVMGWDERSPRVGRAPLLASAFAIAALGSMLATLDSTMPPWLATGTAYLGAAFWSSGAVLVLLSERFGNGALVRLGRVGAVLGAVTAIAALAFAGAPNIDTYTLLQGSSAAVLVGENPYSLVFTPTADAMAAFSGNVDVLSYPPAAPVLLAPARALAGDARWGLVAALVLLVALVTWMSRLDRPRRDDPLSALAPAMVLLAPGAAILAERAWVDPILALALVATVAATHVNRGGLAILACAIALLTKQNAVVSVLLLACWSPFGWRRAAAAVVLAVVGALPFILMDASAFTERITMFLGFPVRADAINLAGWVTRIGVGSPWLLTGLAAVGSSVLVVCGLRLAREGSTASPAQALLALAAGQLAINVFSGHAFYNQHWEVIALLAAAAASGARTGRRRDQDRSQQPASSPT